MCFCDYFVWLKGPNCWVIVITPISWPKCWYLTPQGDHKEAYPPGFRNCFWRIMTILYTKCILWLFCMIKSSKLVSYCHNTHILGKIWPKFGYLTSWGDRIEGYPLGFINYFLIIMNILYTKCVFVTICMIKKSNWWVIVITPIFWSKSGQHFGIWPPGVTIKRVISWGLAFFFKNNAHTLHEMYFCDCFVWLKGQFGELFS